MRRDRIVIAAGGTGGHILPALRIGEQLEQVLTHCNVEYICGRRAIEKKIYSSHDVMPWRLRSSINPPRLAPLVKGVCLAADLAECLASFLAHRPRAVLAMGGAVCFPALTACRLLGIPYFLHESNAVPGRVVRWFARGARRVFLGMGGLKSPNAMLTGTPTAKPSTVAAERSLVLCLGGSQGAQKLNEVFCEAAKQLEDLPCKFLLVTGPGKTVSAPRNVEVEEYISDLSRVWPQVLVAVSRAGAGTLAEIANHRVPSILIPLPHAKDNHQLANAQHFSGAGAAVLLEQEELDAAALARELRRLIEYKERRASLQEKLASFDSEGAAATIADELLRLTKGHQQLSITKPSENSP